MLQMRRNLADEQDGVLAGRKYLIVDCDTKYSQRFRQFVEEAGTKVIRLPPLSPNLNAYAERFVRSIKEECLGRMIFIGRASLRRAFAEYVVHFHGERNHQGAGESIDRQKARDCRGRRGRPSSDTDRWNAQLLLPCRCMKHAFDFLDTTGSVTEDDGVLAALASSQCETGKAAAEKGERGWLRDGLRSARRSDMQHMPAQYPPVKVCAGEAGRVAVAYA
jgi:hypothetical protein